MDDASSETTFMTLDLLREITNDFSEERRIGSGSYGKVYLVRLMMYVHGFLNKIITSSV